MSDAIATESPVNLLARIARGQHGVFSLQQAREAGVGRDALYAGIARGLWERMHPSVYRMKGAPLSWEQSLFAGILWAGPGAVASHQAAGVLWGLDRVRRVQPEVLVPQSQRVTLAGVTVHRTRDLSHKDVTRRAGFPVTNLPRTLIDLASVLSERDLEAALECALRRRLELGWLQRRLESLGRRGRPGVASLQRLVNERWDRRDFMDKPLEVNLYRAIRAAGLPLPVIHYNAFDGDVFLGEADFAYPAQRIALEGIGYSTHGGYRAHQEDAQRANAFTLAGWRLLYFAWTDAEQHPERVAAQIQRALASVEVKPPAS